MLLGNYDGPILAFPIGDGDESGAGKSDSRHHVSVHKLPVTERVLTKCAFDLEAEFAIERDRTLIIRENGQLDSRKVQLFVSQINRRPHNRGADAFALPVVANHHPNLASVIDSRPRRRMKANNADDFAINDGDENVVTFCTFDQ